MASGSTLKSFQSYYITLSHKIDAWNDAHNALTRSLRTSTVLLERVCSLTTAVQSTFASAMGSGVAPRPPCLASKSLSDLYPLLLWKTLDKLERIMHADVQEALAELEAASRAMVSIRRQATQLVHRLKGSKAMMEYSLGSVPSVQFCLEGIDGIVQLYERETTVCGLASRKILLDLLAFLCVNRREAKTKDEERIKRGAEAVEIYRKLVEVVEIQGCLDSYHAVVSQRMHVVLATIDPVTAI
jgi:hypothetical protein